MTEIQPPDVDTEPDAPKNDPVPPEFWPDPNEPDVPDVPDADE